MTRIMPLALVLFWSTLAAEAWLAAMEPTGQDSQTARHSTDAGSAELSGTVLERETKSPVPGAVVTLGMLGVTKRIIVPLGSTPPPGPQVTTDAEGKFTFTDVADGRYIIRVEKDGRAPAFYGRHHELGEASVIQVANESSLRGLTIYLSAGGRIAGRVTTRQGDPVGDAEVVACWKAFSQGVARLVPGPTSTTKAGGEYEFADIAPGDYYLFVRPRTIATRASGPAYVSPRERGAVLGFYPAGAPLDATPALRVESGMSILDADIRLREAPAYRFQGTVASSGSENAHLLVQLREWSTEAALGPVLSSQVASPPDYRFSFDAVPAGRYTATVSTTTDPRSALSTESVDVSRDIRDVKLAAAGGISLAGAIRTESSSLGASGFEPGRLTVRITNVDIAETPAVEARVSKDGSFAVLGLAPGRSVFEVTGLPQAWYVKCLSVSGSQCSGAVLTLAPGSSLVRLDVAVSSPAGSVFGQVVDGTGSALGTATVLLCPSRAEDGPMRVMQSDNDGSFSFRGLAPGSYKILAWRAIARSQVEDPARVAQSKGDKAIEVRSGEAVRATVVAAGP